MAEAINGTAVKEVAELAKAGVRAAVLNIPGQAPHLQHIVTPTGDVSVIHTAAPLLNIALATPDELVKLAKAENEDPDHDHVGCAVFFGPAAVVYVRDLDDRRERATVKLAFTEQYNWLKKASAQAMAQKDFVRLLRITFRGCLPSDSNLLANVRTLKWAGSSEAAVAVQHGRESIGRTLEAKVSGTDVIPEEILLSLPMYENFASPVRIPCAIEINPSDQTFRLTPYPLVLAQAEAEVMRAIGELLSADGLPPAYQGEV